MLKKRGCKVYFYDPHVKKLPINFQLIKELKIIIMMIIIGVKHKKFKDIGIKKIKKFAKGNNNLIFDLLNLFKKQFQIKFQYNDK